MLAVSADASKILEKSFKDLSATQILAKTSTMGLTEAHKIELIQLYATDKANYSSITSTTALSTSQKAATASTTGFTTALKGLWATMAANPLIAIGMAVTAISTAWNIYNQHVQEAIQSSNKATDKFNSASSAIKDYADRYKELHTELLDANTSEERQREIKSDLLSLQKELNDTYGDEHGRLNLVTDAYKDQTNAILAMNKAAAQNYILDNKKGIETATTEMAKERTYELGSTGVLNDDYSKELYNLASLYKDQGINLTQVAGTDLPAYTITFNGNADEAEKVIRELSNKIQDLDAEFKDNDAVGSVLSYTTSALKNNKSILDNYQADYNASLMANIASDDELSKGYDKAFEAVTRYNEAVISGDESKILDARNNLDEVKNSIDLSSEDWIRYGSIMSNVFNEANTGIYDFRDALANNQNGMGNFISGLQGKTKEELLAMQDDAKFDNFDKLIASAEDYGLTVEQVIDELVRMGVVQGEVAKSGEVVSADFATMFSNLPVDKIEKYVSLLNSGDMTEGNISSFEELKKLMSETGMSAEGAVKAIKDFADGFTLSTDLVSNIQNAFDLLQDVEKQYKKTGLIGLSSLESIAKQYPQLRSSVNEYTQGLISADEMMNQLHTAYDNDAESFRTAMAYKMSGNEEFFDSIVNNNQSLFNALAEAYGDDVRNWKTLAQAKADIDKSLISQLADMWGSYYGSFDANVVKGKDGQYSLVSDDPTAVYESGYQAIEQEIAKRNQMIRSLNEAANVEIIIPDFGGIGSASNKSGSGKDKDTSKKVDWIERDLKLLNEQREKALSKANDTSIDYLGLTNDEFNRAKELFNDDTGMMSDKANELSDIAKQAGISLSDLYTLITNGNPGESRENYLAQVLELDKTILPRTEQAVESYKKIWEDAASKISPENKAKIEQGYKDVETLPGAEAEGVQTAIDAYDKWQSIQDSYTESQKKNTDAIMAQYDNRINAINKENEQLEKTNSVLESRMDYLKSIGEIPSASLYENLISNTGTEISNTQKLISELKGKLKEARTKYGKDSEEYINLKENIDDAEASLYTTMQTQEKYNQALAQMPIEHLSTLISMYDDITAKIENWGSVQTATGTKLDGEYYQTLISNGTTIIGQYQKQIKEIKSLMSEYQEGSTIWQELYEQLQDIDSATASMLTNLKKWNAELLAMPLDKINTYSDSLQKVISGLTDVQGEYDTVVSAITGAIKNQIDLLNEQGEIESKNRQKEIDSLEEKLELLDKENEYGKLQYDLEQKRFELERARNQNTVKVYREGNETYENDKSAERQAEQNLLDSEYNLEKYNLQKQIDSAKESLDVYNDGLQDQIDALQKISDKWSEINEKILQGQNEEVASSILGSGWKDKILQGNDTALFNTFSGMYQNTAEQLKKYQDQIDSTNNIQSLLEDYVASYREGTLSYGEALKGINGLLSQLNQNMSATDNLQNIYDYLGTVNGVGADADSILKGIKEGLSVTADNLLASLEQYNKNSGMISEYTSSWQQLTDNVKSMLDVLREVRDNLEDSYDRDDDDDDKTSKNGWDDSDAGNGPGVSRKDGITRGLIGSTSASDREASMKLLGLKKLDPDEVPAVLHMGEAVFNEEQQKNLLNNFASAQSFLPKMDIPNYSDILSKVNVKQPEQIINISHGDLSFPNVRNIDDAITEFAQLSEMAIRQELAKR